ncbi:hypothetical protein J32TS6_39250 [Virgibacillus pantothenticus]|nr:MULTISPECIES: hypothetical protein [Virgibacillus]MBS7426824.1 hypothetical protein [Virgibacillus sp. 19R1-5]MBU8566140.1 hypothetical protein [Virgibacillus pantothenticus]MBU8600564.1 hypothetical protein [Virgibacillus pantothenticus]MBU8634460.1 hypothetical protein [Virgibacillus pantothenticus]MBU8642703.1 hypothetical protein [Virgibacillus pantothenticus]
MEISEGIAHQMDSGLLPENYEPGEESPKAITVNIDGSVGIKYNFHLNK